MLQTTRTTFSFEANLNANEKDTFGYFELLRSMVWLNVKAVKAVLMLFNGSMVLSLKTN